MFLLSPAIRVPGQHTAKLAAAGYTLPQVLSDDRMEYVRQNVYMDMWSQVSPDKFVIPRTVVVTAQRNATVSDIFARTSSVVKKLHEKTKLPAPLCIRVFSSEVKAVTARTDPKYRDGIDTVRATHGLVVQRIGEMHERWANGVKYRGITNRRYDNDKKSLTAFIAQLADLEPDCEAIKRNFTTKELNTLSETTVPIRTGRKKILTREDKKMTEQTRIEIESAVRHLSKRFIKRATVIGCTPSQLRDNLFDQVDEIEGTKIETLHPSATFQDETSMVGLHYSHIVLGTFPYADQIWTIDTKQSGPQTFADEGENPFATHLPISLPQRLVHSDFDVQSFERLSRFRNEFALKLASLAYSNSKMEAAEGCFEEARTKEIVARNRINFEIPITVMLQAVKGCVSRADDTKHSK